MLPSKHDDKGDGEDAQNREPSRGGVGEQLQARQIRRQSHQGYEKPVITNSLIARMVAPLACLLLSLSFPAATR